MRKVPFKVVNCYPGVGGGTAIYGLQVSAAVKGMVFKQVTLG